MKYAVIRIKGRQYKVTEGEELLVDKSLEKEIIPEVLLIVEDGKVKIAGMKPSLLAQFFNEISGDEVKEAEIDLKEIVDNAK